MRPAPKFDGSQACAGADLELFFPTAKGQAAKESTDQAKELCRTCRFMAPCLSWALAGGDAIAGVWGGTTEQERTRMRRRATRTAVAA